ncbi:formate dehydrogenase accessory sulfurtransferase FdhD [Hyphomicrobium sp.]|uniref:formate dehydrogenase accessory sulfurtransferase FdhD n=1 Tax=Hyphomicrobium sp. TaxID=82 RepID=UPI002B6DE317|nr:formate dehydrogenase accessory sulfurtransferase FdhD [Hyphomicrobium sp.]HRN87234.1 formate dehydrogenase accessory sulfurtransferase FdhD [Hyphomicrobium sp.]HRQ26008.1 formate dehydrogenase accessory sulfurtransferase FdhD [Hyphomicrobium sp.]
MTDTSRRVLSRRVSETRAEDTSRLIPEEVPVALVYDGTTHAVMMATPADLEDFGVGFSITEGIVSARDEIRELEIVEHEKGLEARMWLVPEAGRKQVERRRRITGPTSCGLCGVDSLEAAVAEPRRVGRTATTSPAEIQRALGAMSPAQTLNVATRAVHGAAFWDATAGTFAAVREDVGRHNALDKLVGAVATAGLDPTKGFVVLTSRVSVEMVQKTAMMGAEIIVAVSAPTALALRVAEEAGITLVAIARSDAFEIFTHPERITLAAQTGDGDRQEVLPHVLAR